MAAASVPTINAKGGLLSSRGPGGEIAMLAMAEAGRVAAALPIEQQKKTKAP